MNVLIIGLGSIARKHIAALRNIDPEVRIYALRSSLNASEVEGVNNIHNLLDVDLAFDFVIISNPTSLHGKTVESLLELKIPLFIEKPVFDKLGYDELIEGINNSGIPNYVACNLRFLESIEYLHNYIRSNPSRTVNEVNVYCGSYLPEWRPGIDYRQCYSAIPELGGGVNIDLIHDIDYIYWIFGKPMMTRGICRNVSSLGIRAGDYANYSLIYPSFTASIILNYYRRDYKRTVEILFDDETWTLDIKANKIVSSTGKTVFEGKGSTTDTYEAQLRYFIDCIQDGENIENDINSAYEVLKICLNYERLER